ncbi:carboxypeptidase-like regulatory domain-containing protein [Bacteroides sp. UBA939]|uniref:carboxypeptidase-like regulatory domain-containing protein n=1 Tax=Bacteroides sp. UBA939 TaxID=1946092 RepID=UPI0025C6FE70|nr:carboxypeptidase-like regulatory domain-containing protein [Bacteroides sp. UBA939]
MRTKFWYLLLMAFLSASVVTTVSCGDDNNDLPDEPELPEEPKDPDTPDNPQPPVITVTATMKDAEVKGTVTDTEGNPLSGVNISSGETQTVTDDKGVFSFERIVSANGRFRFTFEKNGYFTITRSGVFQEDLSMQVVMQSKSGGAANTTSASFNSTQENTLIADGMKVAIPASALVTSDGRDYSGTVNADMLYLSPDNENFTTMMPGGDMAAVRMDRSDATLVSYGMVEVSLSDASGNSLQLKEGSKSEMTFPIPDSMKDNPPPTIPLWYFNEEAGVWVEEGIATLKRDVYVGSVNHFSWHNLDVAEERVTIKGKVTDCKGRPVSRTMVTVDQTSGMTNSDGNYQVYVPANTPVTVTVKSEDYNSYIPEVRVSVQGRAGGTTVENVNLELPCVPVISGQITNSCSELVGAYVWAEYTVNGKTVTTTPVWTTGDGKFEIRIPGNSGKATLWVRTATGEEMSRQLELTGEDLIITGLEICEDFEEGSLSIMAEDGSIIVLPWISEESQAVVMDNAMIFGYEGFSANIENFSGSGEYTGIAVYYSNDNAVIFEDMTFVFETSDKGGYDVTVTGTGQMFSGTGEMINASITGKVYLPAVIVMVEMRNVGSWSDVGMSSSIPEMPVPIDYLIKVDYQGINAKLASLGYKNKTDEDYDSVKSVLDKAGYEIVTQETTSGSGGKAIAYRKDDNYFIIEYNPQGYSDMEDCKLVVIISEGYSKIQGAPDLTETRAVVSKRHNLKSIFKFK